MARTLAIVALTLIGGAQLLGQSPLRSAQHDYRVVPYAEALVQPWSIAFLPGGDTLITERPGRLRIVRNGKLLPNAVEGVPAVVHSGQGGLLEVAVHPNFATNKLLYLTYSKKVGEPATPKDYCWAARRGADRSVETQVSGVGASVPRWYPHGAVSIAPRFTWQTSSPRRSAS